MENVSCIICSSSFFSTLYLVKDRFSDKKFQLVQCSCGFVYLNPRPNNHEIANYYNHPSYDPHSQNETIFNKLYSFVRSIVMYYRYILIRRFIDSKNVNVLDIGGGKGDFCEYLDSKGINATCQDPNVNRQNLKVNVVTLLDQIKGQDIFNCISMWHSLEHIHDIDKLFIEIDRLTKKGAFLFIAIPNKSSIDRFIFRENWVAWDAPRHLYHFSYRDLSKLLLKRGWKIHSSKILYHDMLYNILLTLKNRKYKHLRIAISILFMVPISLIINHYSSSRLYICQRK